jgi:hypothetical protein
LIIVRSSASAQLILRAKSGFEAAIEPCPAAGQQPALTGNKDRQVIAEWL